MRHLNEFIPNENFRNILSVKNIKVIINNNNEYSHCKGIHLAFDNKLEFIEQAMKLVAENKGATFYIYTSEFNNIINLNSFRNRNNS